MEKYSGYKVLVINPPYMRLVGSISFGYNLPLGIMYVATAARRAGFNAMAYDTEVDLSDEKRHLPTKHIFLTQQKIFDSLNDDSNPVWREVESKIRETAPSAIGLQVMSCKFPMALKVAEIAKKIDPKIAVIAGGHHPTIFPDEVAQAENIDYVVRGEGERTFPNLLETLALGKNPESVRGITYRSNGKIVHNPDRQYEQDLDNFGWPDRTLVMGAEDWSPDKFSFVMSARGCPYPCRFCGTSNMWPKKVRFRSVPNVIAEIKQLQRDYNSRQITFCDDSFTLHKKRTIELCRAMDELEPRIYWNCTTRFDLLDEEILHWMKRSGCNNVAVGVEAGSDRILELLKKETKKEKMREKRELIRQAGISFTSFFMTGLPTETKDEMYETYTFMTELDPDHTHFTIFSPQPNTDLYWMLKEQGKIDGLDWSRFSQENIENFYASGMTQEEFRETVVDLAGKFHGFHMNKRAEAAKSLEGSMLQLYRASSTMKDMGQLDDSIAGFTAVIERHAPEDEPLLPGAYYHRAHALAKKGETVRARADLDECLRLNPNHRKAAKLRESIARN